MRYPLTLTSVSPSVVSNSGTPRGCLLCPWNSLSKNSGVGCHALLQGIFPTQGLSLHLLHCKQILYHLSHQGSLIPIRMTVTKITENKCWCREISTSSASLVGI